MENGSRTHDLNIGVVGGGGIAQVMHLPLLQKHPVVKLQALCDRDTSKASLLAEKFGISNIYEDIDEMIQHEKLDAVFILTPNNLHLPMTLLALDYGLNVFVEKPAGRNLLEVERMKKRASEVGKTVMVGMNNRFRSDVQTMYNLLHGNELGKLFFLKTGWLHSRQFAVKQPWLALKNISGGGVVMDLGVQLIDLVWWLLEKPEPVSVKSFSYNINPDIKVEDFCVACITFANDISVSMEISWEFPIADDQFYLEIAGEQGTGTLNPLKLHKIMHGQIVNITPETKDSKISTFKKSYQNEINHFIDYLLGRNEKLESSVEDSVKVFQITDALYQSIRTGKEVTI
jgi:predicted dehydrogenase